MTLAITYILVSIGTGAVGQVLLKRGMSGLGPQTLTLDGLWPLLKMVLLNPYVLAGLAIYTGGVVFWLAALSRVDLSYAYPFASLSYVVMLGTSWLLFHEGIPPLRILGTVVVCLGVFLISRS